MSFAYVLVNHVPLLAGTRSGTLRLGDLWYEDLCAQSRAIDRVGGRLVVATPHGTGAQQGSFGTLEIERAQAPFAYEPLPLASNLGEFLHSARALRARLGEILSRADVAHIAFGGHPVPPGAVAWPLAARAGCPRIAVFDGSDEVERRWEAVRHGSRAKLPLRWAFASLFDRACRRAVRDADLVFAHNASIPARYAEVWDERCHVFPRSFVTDSVLADDGMLASRARRIAQEDPLVLAAVGRQVPIKATDHVLRALAQAKARGVRVRLVVIGDGDSLPGYRALAAELGIEEDVDFPGAVPYGDSLFALWDRAHATVITNVTAEISRSVLLSMARGIPLLMYENPGTDAMLPPGAASLVATGDVAALAERIVRLANARGELIAQMRVAHRFAAENSLDACHRRRAELARDLVRAGRRGPHAAR